MTIKQALAGQLPEEQQYWFDERAGIYEFDAGMARADAEARAFMDLRKLYTN